MPLYIFIVMVGGEEVSSHLSRDDANIAAENINHHGKHVATVQTFKAIAC